MESKFVRSNRSNTTGIDATTIVKLKKAHATCNAETGEVEIGWPENAPLHEGVIGKDVFAQGATKHVYKVFFDTHSDLYV